MDIKKWLSEEPHEDDVATNVVKDGAKYIPIETAEDLLDTFDSWSTQSFNYYLYKGEGYGNLGVAASIEVVVEYKVENNPIRRTIVGACNFATKSIYPNTHFLATAKSECIKNAISDLGRRLGRGLNGGMIVPSPANIKEANEGLDMPTDFANINLKTNAKKI